MTTILPAAISIAVRTGILSPYNKNIMESITKTLRNYWVVIHSERGSVEVTSVAAYKKDSIKNFLRNSDMTWYEVQKYGWKCIKVNITFTITTK